MKTPAIIVLGLLCTFAGGQPALDASKTPSMKVEWKKDLEDGVRGFLFDGKSLISAHHSITRKWSPEGEQIADFGPGSGGVEIQRIGEKIFLIGGSLLRAYSLSGQELEKYPLTTDDNYPNTLNNGRILHGRLYTAHNYNYMMRYTLDGSLDFTKKIAELSTPKFLQAAGGYIYMYCNVIEPKLGFRLMQYDTLGNQKWSIAPARHVYGLFADDQGYCYMLTAEYGGVGYVEKYDTEGKRVLDVKLPGQCGKSDFKRGDSLFVCGSVSSPERIDGQKEAAFCIISASTGEVFQQQKIDLDPDPTHLEEFTQITSDGSAVYVGGYYGGEIRTPFLMKYSRQGNPTSLNDEHHPRGFNVFPNPGGSRFTITCENYQNKTLKVTVRNLAGQVVLDKEIPCNADGGYTLDLGKQAAGHYTVEIDERGTKTIRKIIIE